MYRERVRVIFQCFYLLFSTGIGFISRKSLQIRYFQRRIRYERCERSEGVFEGSGEKMRLFDVVES